MPLQEERLPAVPLCSSHQQSSLPSYWSGTELFAAASSSSAGKVRNVSIAFYVKIDELVSYGSKL